MLTLPDGSPILVDGETKVPHGVRGVVPRSAVCQAVGATINANPTVGAIDERYVYLDSTAAVRVHLWILL